MKNDRMKIILLVGSAAIVASGAGFQSAYALQKAQAAPEPKSKITPVEAIKIALGKVSGRPLHADFEFDEGKWVYGVMIVNGKIIKEVQVDPISGKIGDVETVTPEGEATEVKAELTKAIGGK